MTRVLGLSASCRAWGNSEIVAKQSLVAAVEAGAAIDFIRLADLKIEPCRGCFHCLRGAGECAINDDVAAFLGRVMAADALVLSTPVYFGLPPAVLVGLLDRLLVVAADHSPDTPRPAVTATVMGNHEWRGVAEPFVNLAASLLGFNVVESLALVAEGPGEVLADTAAMERLTALGRELGSLGRAGSGEPVGRGVPTEGPPLPERPTRPSEAAGGLAGGECRSGPEANARGRVKCPACGSDFFRIEGTSAVCPVCGMTADLGSPAGAVSFTGTADEARLGTAWLKRHVAEWIMPSIERYKPKRKQVLKQLAELKRRYESLAPRDNAPPDNPPHGDPPGGRAAQEHTR